MNKKLLASLAGASAIGILLAGCGGPTQGVGAVPSATNAGKVATTNFRSHAATVTPLLSAGGTLAAFVYYDLSNAWLEPNSASGDTCNASGFCTSELLYAAVGTGSGQAAFLAHDGQGSVGSGEPPDTDTTRFPAISYPYTDLDFAAGDAPLSTTTLNDYVNDVNGTGTDAQRFGAADVIPLLSTSVAVAYNPTGTGLPSGQTLQLSNAALCGIFTGTVTNWDDPTIAASNPGVTFTPGPITVVVRNDGSGTTFLFSNALNAQCKSFASVTGGVGLGAGAAPVWPASFVGEHGSGGIQAEVNATAGSIGYLGANYVQPFAPTGPLAAAVENKAKAYVSPTVAATKLGLKGPYATAGPCGIDAGVQTCYPNPLPNQYLYINNPTNAGAYPIVGFTFGYFYQCSDTAATTKALIGGKGWLSKYVLKAESGGVLTAADTIVESNGLVELSNAIKSNDIKVISTGVNHIENGPVSGVCTL